MNDEQAKALRATFPDSMIGSLPRGGTQLDYVGHAAVTDRLLAVDPEWTWEPFAVTEHGAPLVLHESGRRTLWIRLTVCGVTRIGAGIVKGDKDEVEKELISDALRNAAMRFGVALDLWHKGGSLNGDTPDLPVSTDWTALGWKSEEEHDDAKQTVKDKARSLDDEGKEALSSWAAATGLPKKVMSHAEWAEYAAQVDALALGASDGQEPF